MDTPNVLEQTPPNECVKIRGFFHLQITDPEGHVVGDSGEIENLITNEGKRLFLAQALGSIAGSMYVSRVGLGTGGAPIASDTTLAGECVGTNATVQRPTVTAATSGSTAVQFTATFSSSNSFVTTTQNISNIGLFNSSTGGTLFAGNTYASSSCATNQNVNVTYTITFS